jgi:FHS family glucose/mannose:H+ symporter-like MFS transporter
MSAKSTMVMSCLIYFTLGLMLAALGPALEDLAHQTGSSLAAMGALFTVHGFGALLAQVICGPLNDRWGQRLLFVGGITLIVVGVAGVLLSPSLALLLAWGWIFGIGFGAMDVSNNVVVVEHFPANSVAMLNLSHLFFGVGSVVGPALAGLFLEVTNSALPALGIGAGATLFVIPLALRLPVKQLVTSASNPQPQRGTTLYRSPLLWALGLMLLLYVGAEIGVGGWTTTYVERSTSLSAAVGALITSGFWLALTAGRLVMVYLGDRFDAHTLLRLALIGSLAGGGLLGVSTGSILLTVAGVLLAGFSFGPVYPTIMALTTTAFPYATGRAVSVAAGMGSVGSMVLPWMQGVLLDQSGAAASVVFVAVITLLALALHVGIQTTNDSSRRVRI